MKKKGVEKENVKKGYYLILFSAVIILLIVSSVSAGWFENLKSKITGKATVSLNISVGGPTIPLVFNSTITDLSSSGPNEAPAYTSVIINFTAYSVSGAGNINHSTALVNFSKATEETRQNTSCTMYQSSGNYANYTCNVTMWWWDAAGTWTITAYVKDNQTNAATNSSTTFTMGSNPAFAMGPPTLNWSGISPGATNKTATNDPLALNNTGNTVIAAGNIAVNASNLRGETTSAQALWASNFSVDFRTGGDSCTGIGCLECGGTIMVRNAATGIGTANLTKGNYTINDDSTAQEQLYFCLRLAGIGLTTQSYSTANASEWPWVVGI